MRFRALATLLVAGTATFAASARAELREAPVDWKIGEQTFSGVVVYDAANTTKRPGLLMVPNWMGVTKDAIAMARSVAGDDYVVLIADVYGKDIRPKNDEEALSAVKTAYADGGKTLRERANKALDALKAQAGKVPVDAGKVGAFGFCFGGAVALELVRSGTSLPGGTVSFHGDLESYRPAGGPIQSSILVLNGADDTSVPPEQIARFEQEMKAAKADWQFVNFGGARHCFSQPEDADQPADSNCRYDKRAATRAFEMAHDFFRDQFSREQTTKTALIN